MSAREQTENGAAASDAAFLSQIERYGRLVFSPVGESMCPMLRGAMDVVVLGRADGPLKRLDVALYRNERDEYVLHRLIGRSDEGLLFAGDARLSLDPPVEEKRVLGVMTSFFRNGREIQAGNAFYRLYARIWCAGFGLRRVLLHGFYRAVRLRARLLKR